MAGKASALLLARLPYFLSPPETRPCRRRAVSPGFAAACARAAQLRGHESKFPSGAAAANAL
jgi:hypothetical protein